MNYKAYNLKNNNKAINISSPLVSKEILVPWSADTKIHICRVFYEYGVVFTYKWHTSFML